MSEEQTQTAPEQAGDRAGGDSFWARHGQKIIIGGLGAYLLLLLIGTIAELFDIQPILDWWIWRPPGKPPGDFTP